VSRDKQTEVRRLAKYVISDELKRLLDIGGFDLEEEASWIGVSEERLRKEIRHQADILYIKSNRR
jgi:hypothetical protein